jgi:hypothetical protein
VRVQDDYGPALDHLRRNVAGEVAVNDRTWLRLEGRASTNLSDVVDAEPAIAELIARKLE